MLKEKKVWRHVQGTVPVRGPKLVLEARATPAVAADPAIAAAIGIAVMPAVAATVGVTQAPVDASRVAFD